MAKITKAEFVQEASIAALNGMLSHGQRYKPRDDDRYIHWHSAICKEAVEIAEALASQLEYRDYL